MAGLDVLFVSLFGGRCEKLYAATVKRGFSCLIVSSDFSHGRKDYIVSNDKRYTRLHVTAYKKNLSLCRIYSHLVFAYKLYGFLNRMPSVPKVIYCAMPSSTSALVCGYFAKKMKIRFVIDVIDLWPDSLLPLNNNNRIIYYLLSPWRWITHTAYAMADKIFGESEEYAYVAKRYNKFAPVYPFYLGVNMKLMKEVERIKENYLRQYDKEIDEIRVCYGGSLGNSYDFDTLINAVAKLKDKYNISLWFVGGGEKELYLRKKASLLSLPCMITGRVSYIDYLAYLSICDVGVNSFKRGTLVVHSYKFNDYCLAGLFVLNNLKGETERMINEYQIGLNFDYDSNSLDYVMDEMCLNWFDKYVYHKKNTKKLINDKLDQCKIYSEMSSLLIDHV